MTLFHNCNLLQIEHNTMNDNGNHLLAKRLDHFIARTFFYFAVQ